MNVQEQLESAARKVLNLASYALIVREEEVVKKAAAIIIAELLPKDTIEGVGEYEPNDPPDCLVPYRRSFNLLDVGDWDQIETSGATLRVVK